MSLLATVSPETAQGKVAEVYGNIKKVFGRVPNGMQAYSPSATLLEQQWGALSYYLQHPHLSFTLLAAIRMLVSQENKCDYCIGMNAGLLINMAGWTVEQVSATKRDANNAPLSAKEKAMLLFVLKSVNDRQRVSRADIDVLTQLGWDETDVLDAVAQGARNVAVDIIFNTFQIEKDF
jgi:AhpD family alkylhydroperoxidase